MIWKFGLKLKRKNVEIVALLADHYIYIDIQLSNLEESEIPWPELVRSLAGAWDDDFPDLGTVRSGCC
jgi:hypothetical protein